MKKFIIISFVFVLILAMSAMATETRVWTMGNNNGVLIDDANIWMYPSTIVNYGNLVTVDYYGGSGEFDYVGANWSLNNSNKGTIGTYFSNNYGADRMHLFYGQQLGGNNFGAHLDLNQQSSKYEGTDSSEYGYNYYDLTLGLSDPGGQWDLAVNFGTSNYQYTNSSGFKYQEGDGINNMGVMGRYWKVRNPNYTQVYHVAIMMDKFGYIAHTDTPATDSTFSSKNFGFDAGCGFNFTPSNNVLAVFDFGIMYTKNTSESARRTYDLNDKNFILPYFKLGVDGEVFKWLDVRFGATSYWNNSTDEMSDIDKNITKDASNDTYFGLGFNFNRLHVDIEANPDVFFRGPNFISGANENLSDGSLSATFDL